MTPMEKVGVNLMLEFEFENCQAMNCSSDRKLFVRHKKTSKWRTKSPHGISAPKLEAEKVEKFDQTTEQNPLFNEVY